jgi:DNA (cytosine-5)-methyltransferase 1
LSGGVATMDMGPINEWWISGLEEGEESLVGFSTAYADYYLMQPSQSYAPFMEEVHIKLLMGKVIVEFLLENCHSNNSYQDLLKRLEVSQKLNTVPISYSRNR